MLKKIWIITITAVLAISSAHSLRAQTGAQEQTWTVNFKDSDIHEVIKFVADITGKTMVIDPRVKGRITVLSSESQNQKQLYSLFRSILEVSDFTVVEVGNVVRILPLKEARTSPISVNKSEGDDSEFVTHVIQLKNVAAAKVLPVLRPLIPQHSHFAAYDPSNAIVISDTVANIKRIREVIDKIDRAALSTTEIIQLKYADAENMVATLTKLQGSTSKGASSKRMVMVADKRNNAILLSGEDMKRAQIRELVARLDRPQKQSGNVRVVYLDYADAKDVAAVLTKVVQNLAKLSPGGGKGGSSSSNKATVEADEATNALLITASGDVLTSLLSVVERLDIRRAQVLVEAIIAEIDIGDNQQLGIEWMFQNTGAGVFGANTSNRGIGGIASGVFNAGEDALTSLATGLLGLPVGTSIGTAGDVAGEEFLVLATMLDNATNSNILSTPTLLTMDNNEASISVGQNVPFVTGSFTSSNGGGGNNPFQTIQREDIGITLKVKPQINEGNQILLEISQEISSLSQDASGASDVITNQRKVETQVMTRDGAIIVLGGMIQESVSQREQRVPLLGDIPFFGRLFRTNTSQLRRSNLMIFLKATVVRDDETLRGATAEKYQYIRGQQMLQRKNGVFRMNDEVLPVMPEIPELSSLGVSDVELRELSEVLAESRRGNVNLNNSEAQEVESEDGEGAQ